MLAVYSSAMCSYVIVIEVSSVLRGDLCASVLKYGAAAVGLVTQQHVWNGVSSCEPTSGAVPLAASRWRHPPRHFNSFTQHHAAGWLLLVRNRKSYPISD